MNSSASRSQGYGDSAIAFQNVEDIAMTHIQG